MTTADRHTDDATFDDRRDGYEVPAQRADRDYTDRDGTGSGYDAPGGAYADTPTDNPADNPTGNPADPTSEHADHTVDVDRTQADPRVDTEHEYTRQDNVLDAQNTDPAAGDGTPAAAPATPSATPATTSATTSATGGTELERLVPTDRVQEYTTRWDAVKGEFVDEPRQAVAKADALVGELLDELDQLFRRQRSDLEHGLDADETSTEDLRLAMRRYRSFFDRLLQL